MTTDEAKEGGERRNGGIIGVCGMSRLIDDLAIDSSLRLAFYCFPIQQTLVAFFSCSQLSPRSSTWLFLYSPAKRGILTKPSPLPRRNLN